MSAYAGETVQKKAARALAYGVAREECRGDADGGIVCLAGPGAHDVGPISHFFPGTPPDRVLFVDDDPVYAEANLALAASRMPGCLTHRGPLSSAPIPWKVKLAVLDFCGLLAGENLVGASAVMRRLAFGGVVLLTTLKGRDGGNKAVRLAADGQRDLARVVSNTSLLALTLRVPFAVAGQVLSDPRMRMPATARVLTDIGGVHYTASSPMSVCIAKLERKIDAERRRSRYLRDIQGLTDTADRIGGMSDEEFDEFLGPLLARAKQAAGRDDKTLFRSLVRRTDGPEILLRLGFPPAAYDVTPGTMAAWRAHRTMGTYREA